MKRKIIVFLMLSVLAPYMHAQLSGKLFQLTHTYSPDSDFDFHQSELGINFPVKVNKTDFLINSINVRYNQLSYNEEFPFDVSELENLYSVNYALSYSMGLKKRWRLTGRLSTLLSSNFAGSLSTEDFLITGGVFANKSWGNAQKNSALTFGLAYATISGSPGIIPIVSYRKKVNDRFSYGIGFPNTFLQYNIRNKHVWNLGIEQRGFNANLSGNNSPIVNNTRAQNVQFSNIITALRYEYVFDNFWSFNVNTGYGVLNNYILTDEDREEVYDFDVGARPFFTIGVSYDLIRAIRVRNQKNNKP